MSDTDGVAADTKYVVRIVPTRYGDEEYQEPCVVLAADGNEVVCTGETRADADMVADALNTVARLEAENAALLYVAEAAKVLVSVARTEKLPTQHQMDAQWEAMSRLDAALARLEADHE